MRFLLALALALAPSCAGLDTPAAESFAQDIQPAVEDVTLEYEQILSGDLDPAAFTPDQVQVRLIESQQLRQSVAVVAGGAQ